MGDGENGVAYRARYAAWVIVLSGALALRSAAPARELLPIQTLADGDGLDGLTAVAVFGNHLYAAAETGDAVLVFTRDPLTGVLAYASRQPVLGAAGVAVSPDGANVYVTGPDGFPSELKVYDRKPVSGDLTLVETHLDNTGGVDGLEGAREVVVTADGDSVYVAGARDHAVAVFRRQANGRLLW